MAIEVFPPVTAPETVIGYHGCSRRAAASILRQHQFLRSTKAYDWLGEGFYFWEYAPYRARDWAKEKFAGRGEEVAVIGATILLGRCLNLLDTEHMPALVDVYDEFIRSVGAGNLPQNTERGAHFLDRAVIDGYCRLMEQEAESALQTIRGTFPEGKPIYQGSKILQKAHTQIAVRDTTCISRLHLVTFR